MGDTDIILGHVPILSKDEMLSKRTPISILESSVRVLQSSSDYLSAFGYLKNEKSGKKSKWYVSVPISALLDDPSVLIEGVLFRARYLGSTQLVCEGEPTKSTRMCQAEEAVSRIKVCLSLSSFTLHFTQFHFYRTRVPFMSLLAVYYYSF